MKYFSIEEMTKSDTAKAKGIDNTPSQEVIDNLTKLIEAVLDPLRELWGSAIVINSGYRCEELNKAVGGVSTSHHKLGCAADITVGSVEKNKELFNKLLNSDLKWTQAISEKGCRWIHISYVENNLKKQVLYT
jgi:uncharacterized protein YcbK (DUF882 family)